LQWEGKEKQLKVGSFFFVSVLIKAEKKGPELLHTPK